MVELLRQYLLIENTAELITFAVVGNKTNFGSTRMSTVTTNERIV